VPVAVPVLASEGCQVKLSLPVLVIVKLTVAAALPPHAVKPGVPPALPKKRSVVCSCRCRPGRCRWR
jgi:hypothetical protein